MWEILLFLAPVPPNDNCCQKITLSSQGGVQEHYLEALGDYVVESTDDNGKPIFRHKTNLISVYLHHTSDQEHNWSGWQFTRDVSDVFGFISNENEDKCPSGKIKITQRPEAPWLLKPRPQPSEGKLRCVWNCFWDSKKEIKTFLSYKSPSLKRQVGWLR